MRADTAIVHNRYTLTQHCTCPARRTCLAGPTKAPMRLFEFAAPLATFRLLAWISSESSQSLSRQRQKERKEKAAKGFAVCECVFKPGERAASNR